MRLLGRSTHGIFHLLDQSLLSVPQNTHDSKQTQIPDAALPTRKMTSFIMHTNAPCSRLPHDELKHHFGTLVRPGCGT